MSIGIQSLASSPLVPQAETPGVTSASSTPQVAGDRLADPNGPFANLNLTPQQQQQIQSILSQNASGKKLTPRELMGQVEALLTPQQQQLMRNDLQTLRSHHHHHGHGHAHGSTDSTSLSNTGIALSKLGLTSAE